LNAAHHGHCVSRYVDWLKDVYWCKIKASETRTKVFIGYCEDRSMPPAKEHRHLIRMTRYHGAWITFDDNVQSYECRVLDISGDSARLVARIDAPLGSSFKLSAVPTRLREDTARSFGEKVDSWASSSPLHDVARRSSEIKARACARYGPNKVWRNVDGLHRSQFIRRRRCA
jgi:hypothetical protein